MRGLGNTKLRELPKSRDALIRALVAEQHQDKRLSVAVLSGALSALIAHGFGAEYWSIVTAFAAGIIGYFVAGLFFALRPAGPEAVALHRQEPIWGYEVVHNGANSLVLGFTNGVRHQYPLFWDGKQCLYLLGPRAFYGFTPELEKAFLQSPALFLEFVGPAVGGAPTPTQSSQARSEPLPEDLRRALARSIIWHKLWVFWGAVLLATLAVGIALAFADEFARHPWSLLGVSGAFGLGALWAALTFVRNALWSDALRALSEGEVLQIDASYVRDGTAYPSMLLTVHSASKAFTAEVGKQVGEALLVWWREQGTNPSPYETKVP